LNSNKKETEFRNANHQNIHMTTRETQNDIRLTKTKIRQPFFNCFSRLFLQKKS